MKRTFWLLPLFFLFGMGTLQAQAPYQNAIGIRLGLAPGLTIKHSLGGDAAIEGIFSSRWRGFLAIGLYEIHFPALGVDNLRWYIGGGGHVGVWTYNNRNHNNPWFENDGGIAIGLDAIGGLEYTIPDVPINFSIDWKPGFNLIGYTGFWTDGGGLSVRYCF